MTSTLTRRDVITGGAAGLAALLVSRPTAAKGKKPARRKLPKLITNPDDSDNPTWTFARAKRLDAGLTVPEMAWCLGVSPSSVWRYERGAKVPRHVKIFYLLMGSALVCRGLRHGGVSVTNVAASLLPEHSSSVPPQIRKLLDSNLQ